MKFAISSETYFRASLAEFLSSFVHLLFKCIHSAEAGQEHRQGSVSVWLSGCFASLVWFGTVLQDLCGCSSLPAAPGCGRVAKYMAGALLPQRARSGI